MVCGSCQHQRTTLWFDEKYATAYAANDCRVKQQIGKPCTFSPAVYVSSFEQQAQKAFATDEVCHGLFFRTGVGKTGEWELFVDQEGDAAQDEQNWRLGRVNSDHGLFIESADAPERIIDQVCSAISGRGGEVEK
jgi:hypothetical protein